MNPPCMDCAEKLWSPSAFSVVISISSFPLTVSYKPSVSVTDSLTVESFQKGFNKRRTVNDPQVFAAQFGKLARWLVADEVDAANVEDDGATGHSIVALKNLFQIGIGFDRDVTVQAQSDCRAILRIFRDSQHLFFTPVILLRH